MIWRLILWLCLLPVVPILYVTLANEATFKKNIAVGVTLPYEGREDETVKARLGRYKRELGWTCAALAAVVVPCLFVKDFGPMMFLWGVWLILCVALPYVPYVRCNRDLKRLKAERGWGVNAGETVTVDTGAISPGKWLSPWLFVPAVALCLLPLVWDRSFWLVYTADAVCAGAFWFCYRWLYRNRAEMVDGNTELTKVLTQVRRYNWGRMWLICGYSMAVLNIGFFLTRDHPNLSLLLVMLICVVLVWAVLRVEFATRRAQEKLTAESGRDWYVDEDDKWIGGVLYYNPNDSRSIVNSRVGTGSSFNMARPAGKITMGLVGLLLLAVPFTGFFFNSASSKPITLELSGAAVTAVNGKSEYTVPLADIAEAELLEELPEKLIRTNGTGMENLLKGRFKAPELGQMTLCLDPTCPPFLLLTTSEGKLYLFGSREEGQTEAIFEQIGLTP
ncbi:MAG: hypothetical protein ACI4PC_03430 [Oscillospiraceae bacterium]